MMELAAKLEATLQQSLKLLYKADAASRLVSTRFPGFGSK